MPITISVRKPPSEHKVSVDLLEMIKHFEGYVPYAYDDKEPRYPKTRITPENAHLVKGRLTIGYGRAVGVQPGDKCTHQEAEFWLMEDVEKHAQIVRDKVKVPLTPSEFNALTDIVYNLGYIPKSMLACLNGGVTDKGVKMEPGSYGSALKEFPRNCRWGGIPVEAIYRRRLADACMFSDLPWENACSKNIVKLVHSNGVIDAVASTSLEDTLLKARQDVRIQKPNTADVMKAPWPSVVDEMPAIPPLNPEVIIADTLPLPPSIEDELLLEKEVAAAESAPQTEQNIGSSKPVSPESASLGQTAPQPPRETAPASTIPPVVIPTEKPKAPVEADAQPPKKKDTMDTIAKDAGLDRSAVVKAVTAWMVWLGNSLRSFGAAGMKIFGLSGSSLSVIADQLQQPFVQIMVATAFFVCVTGAIWFVGLIAEKGALRVKIKAERAEAAT